MKYRVLKETYSMTKGNIVEGEHLPYVALSIGHAKDLGIIEEIKPDPPKFRAYSKVNPEWVGKTVKNKHNCATYLIIGIMLIDNEVIVGKSTCGLRSMFAFYDWSDGSPFGEEVSDENV